MAPFSSKFSHFSLVPLFSVIPVVPFKFSFFIKKSLKLFGQNLLCVRVCEITELLVLVYKYLQKVMLCPLWLCNIFVTSFVKYILIIFDQTVLPFFLLITVQKKCPIKVFSLFDYNFHKVPSWQLHKSWKVAKGNISKKT